MPMNQTEKQELALRISVFYLWVISLSVTVAVFLLLLGWRHLTLDQVKDPFASLTKILTPQISVMAAFFFRVTKQKRMRLVETDPALARLTIILCSLYHLALNVCLVLGVLLGRFGDKLDDNVNVLTLVAGYLSLFGSAPVAFLFTTSGD
jgi:hypothetical protein